ncbi:MAG: hypothetical protein HZB76_03820, partial [Chlamydiae bacterium]|nr:hypothetical protein [Chlamydiota bacterium]
MKKVTLILLLVFPLFCFSKTLKLEDVNEIMDRFFEYHVENKELNDTIVKRWVKGYIEQFDSSRVYLLQEEVLPFLDLSSKDAKKMVAKISKKDFSDFIALNELIQKAILRSRDYRIKLEKLLILNDEGATIENEKFVSYASNLKELEKRQRNTIISFYSAQKEKGLINSVEKKEKLFSLLERKLSRFENNFLHQNQKGQELSLAEKQHFLSVRILKSFAKSLDAHSSFFSEEEAEEMRMSLEKQFDGIGVVLSEGVEGVIITDLIKNSPAEKSGQIQTN